MDRKQLENINFNAKMMEDAPSELVERLTAHEDAKAAIMEGYLAEQEEDVQTPADFEQAVEYASALIYRSGANPHSGDALRSIEIDLEYERKKQDAGWLPETDDQLALAHTLFVKGSRLAAEDFEPAFSAHRQGRNHEVLDPHDSVYNKFGELIPSYKLAAPDYSHAESDDSDQQEG